MNSVKYTLRGLYELIIITSKRLPRNFSVIILYDYYFKYECVHMTFHQHRPVSYGGVTRGKIIRRRQHIIDNNYVC